MNRLRFLPILLSLALPAWPAEKKAEEPGITRAQADAILNELRNIRQLLEKLSRQQAAAPEAEGKTKLKLEGSPMLGNKDAPLTMVEFTDYQCGFCQNFHLSTFPEIRKKYIDTGKLRFASRDLPLDFHTNAFRAAEAGRCAGDQGRFWEMRDLLVANANKLSAEEMLETAKGLRLDLAAFRACLDSGRHKDDIMKDVSEASALDINGTPSFIIGRTTAEGVAGDVLVGAQPLAAFEGKLKKFEPK